MKNLSKMKWTDSKMQMHVIRLIKEMSPDWKRASHLLGLNHSHIKKIEENNRSVEDCCREVMRQWLSAADEVYNYPKSWKGLCELLEDMKLSVLSYKLLGQSKTLLFILCLQHMYVAYLEVII